jgi:hypothetical protein
MIFLALHNLREYKIVAACKNAFYKNHDRSRVLCHAGPIAKPHFLEEESMSKNTNPAPSPAAVGSDKASGNEKPVLKRRPRIYGELMETTCFRLPKSWVEQIDERTKGTDKSRSDFIRSAIETALKK